jgi:hypothetical protein
MSLDGGLRGGPGSRPFALRRIVLPPETGEQPSLLLEYLSDAPWLNRSRPGSLYSIIE